MKNKSIKIIITTYNKSKLNKASNLILFLYLYNQGS